MNVNLITHYFVSTNAERQKEINACVEKNNLAGFDDIIRIVDGKDYKSAFDTFRYNFHTVFVCDRREFGLFFGVFESNAINVIANADIYFDRQFVESIKVFYKENPPSVAMALSRWDVGANGNATLYDRSDSQDTWVFAALPPLTEKAKAIVIGKAGCDNALAYEISLSGMTVVNPCHSIRSYHLHNSGFRTYNPDDKIPPPYLLVPPTFL